MKNTRKIGIIALLLVAMSFVACNDFLDREPLSDVTPEVYFRAEADLEAYAINLYDFPTHGGWNAGTFIYDNGTDNQASVDAYNRWVPGEWKVGTSGGSWNFDKIRKVNYFLDKVLPLYKKGNITGAEENIKHYIGEVYFLRAYEYFNKVQSLGDFPIIKTTLPDKKEELIEASKRRPRNEVARFILEDLDKAISMMKSGAVKNKNRLSKEVAQLFKSRVALHEGTWLKYHKGTARVPGGPGWPGKDKEYLSSFSIDIDAEIDFFLTQAMSAAKAVADNVPLVNSDGVLTGKEMLNNPYFKMFGDFDLGAYSEVLLWRAYDAKLVGHHTMHYLNNGAGTGYTKDFVETFLMKNGKPIYAAGTSYKGDNTIADVRTDRDARLQLFMQAPGDVLIYESDDKMLKAGMPGILDKKENKAVTGYNVKKGIYGGDMNLLEGANPTTTGSIVFRATEAYLNYIEASYEKNGSLDGTATSYWKQLRERAGLPADFNVTISATDLSKESDWAKYSGGNMVDVTLYNIRRERRCELIAEGFRYFDLKRWRALDQVSNYQVEGFKVWSSAIFDKYKNEEGKSSLRAEPDADPNISPKANSEYLRPYQIVKANNKFYDGYNWTGAHYLSPIAFEHFLIASPDGNAENSVIYQNPNWPIEANGAPN
ncbi:MAG: RagB/SusD family nutrient uptake outer membrane protein [Flavobacteriaceae bacterium]|nr:RagB/SusD family nutrient uptake outer membrane protein [Flavobacteriaceae bacterium]